MLGSHTNCVTLILQSLELKVSFFFAFNFWIVKICFKPIRKVGASVSDDLKCEAVPSTDVQEDVMTWVPTN